MFSKSLCGLGPLKCHKQGSDDSHLVIFSKSPTLLFAIAGEI